MSAPDGPAGHRPEPSPGGRGRLIAGRHVADRRLRRPIDRSPYFRHAGPGTVTARPAAIEPRRPIDRFAAKARRAVFGRPLSSDEEAAERLSKVKALAVFSSDNLSSVAYATEAILFTLLAAGRQSFWLTLPISLLIVFVLGIIVVSYRQTIGAYPGGGGSYIVAGENLGRNAGLVAAAALLVDYVLTVSVSVAAGVAAIASAFPGPLADHRVEVSAAFIVLVMVVNLRGIRESGTIFAVPTYVFLFSMLGLMAVGLGRAVLGDAPQVSGVVPVVVAPETLGILLLMRAFADGCSAITGVEAVSNGVPAFRRPESLNARTTLAVMGVLVGLMFIGVSILAGISGAIPSEHETVISQIGRAVFGTGVVYYVLQLSTMGILVLAANTAFADFPRLASLLARDGFMPARFAFRGERLAFNAGIVALAALAIGVLAIFGGRVEALIPLYAVGVFTSITLSQAGMVVHWLRERGDGWRRSAIVNGFGAVATGIVTVVFAVAKFALGAWLIVIVIPVLVAGMLFVGRQYARRRAETAVRPEAVIGPPTRRQRVLIPASDVTRDVVQAVKFGRTMSDDVSAIHVTDDLERAGEIRKRFARQLPGLPLIVVESPFRSLVRPLVRYLEDAAANAADQVVIVLLPEYVPRHWWERFLYNDSARRIEHSLLGRPNILVAAVPYRRDV
ncbi:MAG TPA: APC family permease [Verrucomicrobiae bacterium]|nr:APC family permease [Verrucomicrobiae bacterium]